MFDLDDCSGFSLAPWMVKGEYPHEVSSSVIDLSMSGGQVAPRSPWIWALSLSNRKEAFLFLTFFIFQARFEQYLYVHSMMMYPMKSRGWEKTDGDPVKALHS